MPQRACLELRRFGGLNIFKILMVGPNYKRNPLTSDAIPPTLAWRPATLCYRCRNCVRQGTVNGKKNAQGCTLSSEVARWDSTAPTPTSDASTSTTNWACGIRGPENGYRNEAASEFGNAASAAFDHLNVILVEVKAVRGTASWLKLRIKRR